MPPDPRDIQLMKEKGMKPKYPEGYPVPPEDNIFDKIKKSFDKNKERFEQLEQIIDNKVDRLEKGQMKIQLELIEIMRALKNINETVKKLKRE